MAVVLIMFYLMNVDHIDLSLSLSLPRKYHKTILCKGLKITVDKTDIETVFLLVLVIEVIMHQFLFSVKLLFLVH